ncbi:Gp37-like protein [Listeria fleischmannii]|uniref:Uncharacterized protein n=1 Tax=Listeria fleischmannii FSL S10-1203 TaxID=1265822 RepID=W7DND0_9LIST|nr:aspartate-semialdehyde dehydrogenase [Listeria fleischmannii]EUJ56620.1 hypothetical protein MCOL2_08841 [Listeria fleischmannii FSL S10-1203]
MNFLIVFDKQLNQKSIIPFSEATLPIHIWDWQTFQFTTTSQDIETDDFITIIENKQPIFSGIIVQAVPSGNVVKVEGYDLRYLLDGMQVNYLYKRSLVSAVNISGNSVDVIKSIISKAFPLATVILEADENRTTFSFSPRLKTAHEFLRLNNVNNDMLYQIYIVSKKRIIVKIKYLRDLSHSVVLLSNITHEQVEKTKSVKNKYNQILGLGSGEDDNRDYYFHDAKKGDDYPHCYIYDLRENITSSELKERTLTKFKELEFEYFIQLKTLNNNVAKFLVDYDLGDYVTFTSDKNEAVKDLITFYTIEYKNGIRKDGYELSTGINKNALTQKIKELKEGGYK